MDKENISLLLLERYALGELPSDQMERVRRALERDEGLRQKLELISESSAAILRQYPAPDMAQEIRLKTHSRRVQAGAMKEKNGSWRLARIPRPLFAVAIIAVVASLSLVLHQHGTMPSGDVRVKGMQPHLIVFRKTVANPGVEELRDLSTVQRGDVLQLGYIAMEKRYGVIVSIDGNGLVTQHFPETAAGSSRLATGKTALLSEAYELDNAPRFERFFFVTSDRPIEISRVLDAAKRLAQKGDTAENAALDLPRSFGQCFFTLKKN